MAARAVNSNAGFSFPWKTTICPCWNVEICCSLVLASLGSLQTRQIWLLCPHKAEQKHAIEKLEAVLPDLGEETPSSFYAAFQFSQEVVPITKSSCGKPIQPWPIPGSSSEGRGSSQHPHRRNGWWRSLWHQVQESVPRIRQEEQQPQKESLSVFLLPWPIWLNLGTGKEVLSRETQCVCTKSYLRNAELKKWDLPLAFTHKACSHSCLLCE